MMVALLVAGIGILLAGLLAIGYGIPVKEFSFGNTLIVAGAITACAGAIMLGLWVVVRELRVIARRLGPDHQSNPEIARQPATGRTPRSQAPDDGFLFNPDQPAVDHAGPPATSPPPWYDEAASPGRGDAPAGPDEAEAEPEVKPRRNLLFSSSSRKERERASARAADPSDSRIALATAAPPPLASPEPPPATFDDAWPKSDRARATEAPPPPPPRRSVRAPTTSTEAGGAPGPDRHPPPARKEDASQVTVLKSGVVDGMAYSLYSDGSIEAQMPEGMMRFASIDDLRAHLDQRP